MYLLVFALVSLYVKFFTEFDIEIAYSIIMAGVFIELLTRFSRKKVKKQEEVATSLSDYMKQEYGVRNSSGKSDKYEREIIDSKKTRNKIQD